MEYDILLQARCIMGNVSTMNWDCGRICGAACCQPDEDGQGGVYLFPGEEVLLQDVSWAEIVPANMDGMQANMLMCAGTCERKKRPLGCMIFPLTPVTDAQGRVDVRFDYRARAMCPLLRDGLGGLRTEFITAARSALARIARDENGLRFLRAWQALEEQYDFHL